MSDDQKPTGIRYIKDPILEPYFIQLDDYCYAVQQVIIAQESGKEYQNTLGFYSDFGSCLKAIAKNEVKKGSYKSIKEFLEEYNKIIEKLKSVTDL
jgi:hypothetical protein